MSRILVTGGAGFIGSSVVKALATRGDEVIAFDIARIPLASLRWSQSIRNIEFVQGEITEWPQVVGLIRSRKPDAVVHCAAIVGVTNSLASPIGTFRVNVDGSLNLFEAMRLFGVRRVVNLSSEETYGIFEADTINENHPNRPLKPYGISKYAVERLACDYQSAHGMEIMHVRTCWVYGRACQARACRKSSSMPPLQAASCICRMAAISASTTSISTIASTALSRRSTSRGIASTSIISRQATRRRSPRSWT